MSTIALIGGDGSGKTTVAKYFPKKYPESIKYLYMGCDFHSSNFALPTSRLLQWMRYVIKFDRTNSINSNKNLAEFIHRPKNRLSDHRGKVSAFFRLFHRLAEEWFRQIISWIYQIQGFHVIYDRHFIYDYLLMHAPPECNKNRWTNWLHDWLLLHCYPKPDLFIFLDVDPKVMFKRKGETSIEYLNMCRDITLQNTNLFNNFVRVDASQSIDKIYHDVQLYIDKIFFKSQNRIKNKTIKASQMAQQQPYAVIVGLDSLQGLQAARVLSGHRVPVIALASRVGYHACYTRVCDQIIYTDTENQTLIDALISLGKSLHQKAVLYPCHDLCVLLVSKHRKKLEKFYFIMMPSHEIIMRLTNKDAFYQYAREQKLPLKSTYLLRSRVDAEKASVKVQFPCIVKPNIRLPEWMAFTSLKAFKIYNAEKLLEIYDHYHHLADMLIVQEWIEGPETNQFTCHVYFDEKSKPVVTFVSRKIRQWPPLTGQRCLGEECRNDEVLEITKNLFQNVGYQGLGYLEMKWDDIYKQYYIIEANIGRPTGTTTMAEAAGVDILYTMYCDCLDMELPENIQQKFSGMKWINLLRDIEAVAYHIKRGELTLLELIRSWRGPKTYGIFSWRDPLPFLMAVKRVVELLFSSKEVKMKEIQTPLEN